MKVRVRIDSIVIEGADAGPHQAPALRAALVAGLARYFAARETYRPSRSRRLVRNVPAFSTRDPERFGEEIGCAIYGSLPRHAE
jgi:hypothetical protein